MAVCRYFKGYGGKREGAQPLWLLLLHAKFQIKYFEEHSFFLEEREAENRKNLRTS